MFRWKKKVHHSSEVDANQEERKSGKRWGWKWLIKNREWWSSSRHKTWGGWKVVPRWKSGYDEFWKVRTSCYPPLGYPHLHQEFFFFILSLSCHLIGIMMIRWWKNMFLGDRLFHHEFLILSTEMLDKRVYLFFQQTPFTFVWVQILVL